MGWSSIDHQFPADHPVAKGHFPDNPIIPGALLLDHILRAIASPAAASPQDVRLVKFLHPVRPGDHVTIRWRQGAGGNIDFECHLPELDKPALIGSLKSPVS